MRHRGGGSRGGGPTFRGCRRRNAAPLVAAVSLLASLLAVASAREEGAWIALEAPPEAAVVRGPAAWIELRGRAGLGERAEHDLVILLDLSSSTWLASGVDVDGDGEVGRTRGRVRQLMMRNVQPTRLDRTHFSSDPDDTVRAAQAAAARRLVERLDPNHTRAALVAFDEAPRVEAPLGSPRETLLAALDRLESEGYASAAGTDFAAALREATRILSASDAARRQRRILLLSDGEPTLPVSERRARAEAAEAARAAAARGVRVDCFALGSKDHELDAFREIAELTGGALTRTPEPGDIVDVLPRVRLADVDELTIANRTAKLPARAQRLFADGSFDAFAPLVPGANELHVRATSRAGASAELTRVISFEPREAADPTEARRSREELERLVERLEQRTVEAELRRELEEARREAQRRELELEAEAP